jgi:hypothetical protein
MAKIIITISDEINEQGSGIRYALEMNRDGEPPELARFPATPAMLTALTIKRLTDAGAVNTLVGFVCNDIMTKAGLSPAQQKIAEERGFAAAVAEEAKHVPPDAAAEALANAEKAVQA